MAEPSKKRKRAEEPVQQCPVREFQESWTEKYFFIEHKGKLFCLLCNKDLSLKSIKVSNIKRHYETVHLSKNISACGLSGDLRKNKINQLKKNLQVQSSMITKKVLRTK